MASDGRLTRSGSKSKSFEEESEDSCSPPSKKPKSNKVKKSASKKAKRLCSFAETLAKNGLQNQMKMKTSYFDFCHGSSYLIVRHLFCQTRVTSSASDKSTNKQEPDEKKTSTKQSLTPEDQGTLYQVKKTETFNIKSGKDGAISTVVSMCLLDSGDILTADTRNPILKQINGDTYEICNILNLPATLESVCKVGETEAIVALSNYTLKFVSAQNKLEVTRTVKLDHYCVGVCVISENIYITDGRNANLHIYDLDCHILKTIDGQKIFSWNRFIVGNDDGKTIYVTDLHGGLIKLDRNGEVIWKCDIALKGAYDLCTDGLGNVFVSGSVSKNVVQISSDGQFLGEIVPSSKSGKRTFGICFDRQKSKLFVATYACDDISVYCFK